MSPKIEDPYILCLKMDAVSLQRLSAWRKQYFPPERNFLEAHLTLYHRLPFTATQLILSTLKTFAQNQLVFPLSFEELTHQGGFLGIKAAPSEVLQVKGALDRAFDLWLAPQDRQKIMPHVTVMNNAPPEATGEALRLLKQEFAPWQGRAEGLQLFRYRQGPWEWVADFLFQ